MDYEILYKNALERAKKFIEENPLVQNLNTWIKETFPELKEPEDEKVRKALIEMVHDTPNSECEQNYNVRKEDCLTWLEKQGESYTKRDVDNAYIEGMASAKRELEKQDEQKPFDYEHANIQQKDFAPKVEWKPSDEQMATLYKYAEQNNYDGSILTSLYNDLNKLKGE
jgi:hypothetical protein